MCSFNLPFEIFIMPKSVLETYLITVTGLLRSRFFEIIFILSGSITLNSPVSSPTTNEPPSGA